MKQVYQERYHIIENLPQIEGADYGDLARQEAEKKREIRQKYGRGR